MVNIIEEQENQKLFNVLKEGGHEVVVGYDNVKELIEDLSKSIKRTSAEWVDIHDFNVIDPDGWDRKNFQYSWYEEKITWTEYETRAMASTRIIPTK